MTTMVRSPGARAASFLSYWSGRARPSSTDGTRGASLMEYALLVALIAIACIVAIELLGGAAGTSLDESGSTIANG